MSSRLRWCMLPLVVCVLAAYPVSANLPTRTTINVDGNMGDWNTVLLNGVNAHTDPVGSTAPSTDRDALNSAPRDLVAYAYTWDDTNFYGYVQRVASAFNFDRVLIYFDVDNDGFMEAGDRVLHVRWSWFFVFATLHAYNPAVGFGDPMTDGMGLADGYTLPGTLGGSLNFYWAAQAGNGVEMECLVPWADLGVAAGAAVGLHVSMVRNASIPANIEDNMAATGGGPLTTNFEEASITPDLVSSQPGGDTVVYAHQLVNSGNMPTTAEIGHTWGCAGTPTVTYWEDVNGNSTVEPGTDIQLTDSNFDTNVDRVLATGETVDLLIQVVLPGGVPGGTSCDLTLTIFPRGLPGCFTTATDTNTYPDVTVTLVKSVDRPTASPGQVLTYTTSYTNTGVDSAFVVVVSDAVPANTTYVPGSASGAGTVLTYSHDFGSNWDTSEAAPVTDVRWSLVLPLAAGENGIVSFQVVVD